MESHSERDTEIANLRGKHIALEPDSSNILGESPVLLYQLGSDWPEHSPQTFKEVSNDQIVQRNTALVHGSESQHDMPNDDCDMVEELLFQNYKNLTRTVVGDISEGVDIGQRQLHQIAGGFRKVTSRGDPVSKGKQPFTLAGIQDLRSKLLPEVRVQRSNQTSTNILKNVSTNDNNNISSAPLLSSGGIRTKVLSYGIPRFLVKDGLKGKGVVHKYPETLDGFAVSRTGQNSEKAIDNCNIDDSLKLRAKAKDSSPLSVTGVAPVLLNDGISLRDWMKPGYRKVNKAESLHIFAQIVQLMDVVHSQGIALPDLQPSCFKLLPSNGVKYVGSLAKKELLTNITDIDIPFSKSHLTTKRHGEENMHARNSFNFKRPKLSENFRSTGHHREFSGKSALKCDPLVDAGAQDSSYDSSEQHYSNSDDRRWKRFGSSTVSDNTRLQVSCLSVQLEEKWYTCPEKLSGGKFTCSSNIYSLGILLFELLSCSRSLELHTEAMLEIQHRILPPYFLAENPKEAGFCLWLLHPDPSSRPTTREILQSELISGSQDLTASDQLTSSSANEDHAESELMLHFLTSLNEQKDKHASQLLEVIESLETDIKEVEKRHLLETKDSVSLKQLKNLSNTREQDFLFKEPLNSKTWPKLSSVANLNDDRLMKNINQLENAYLSMRSQTLLPDSRATARLDTDLLNHRGICSTTHSGRRFHVMNQKQMDRFGAFSDGLCKYSRYTKFEVCGKVRNADLLNTVNVICSLSFDRDEDYFAAAGVSKKIKIFDFNGLLNDSDIHYPVSEMSSKSRLSSVCWNSYIKNYLASTDYDGMVQLWDASSGQGFAQFKEHGRRAWSVDFSQMDPTKLASGSDDCTVKLWNINERKSIGTIKSFANVCCVQFSPYSTNLLAFGSSDYKTYCYDLRNTRIPWCTLAGHGKAVSYVKFLDHETVVSASTDSTLKLWDLKKTSSNAVSTNACTSTFRGHTNEKNFVGLTVSDGYIACGSETNEIYAYYKSLSMPITSYEFGSIDPISGQETSNDNGQFVSSVCWRKKSNTLVAANSSGTIKLLRMV